MNADAVMSSPAGRSPPDATSPRDSDRSRDKRIEALLATARSAYADKRTLEVLSASEQVLELDPDNYAALRYAARSHTHAGDVDRAEVYWRRLCVIAADKIEPALNVARIAHGRSQWDVQAEFADIILREDPERADALRLAIQGRVYTKRFDELADLLPRLYPKDPERTLTFLRNLGGVDQLPVLAAAFRKIADDASGDTALTAFRQECLEAWRVGARRAAAKQDIHPWSRFLRAIHAIEPRDAEAIEGLAVVSRDGLINMRKAIAKGDRDAAIYHARAATQINPALLEAWYMLGYLTREEAPGEAADSFDVCTRLAPDDPHYQLCFARAAEAADRLPAALRAYTRALTISPDELDPTHAEAAPAIAVLRPRVLERAAELADGGELGLAWEWYDAATAASEQPVPELAAKAFLGAMAAGLRRSLNQGEPGAMVHAERFLALEPDNKEILALLGATLAKTRQHARAKGIWRKLVDVFPGVLAFQVRLARSCHALGRHEEGAAAAAAALKLDGGSAVAQEVAALFGLVTPASPAAASAKRDA